MDYKSYTYEDPTGGGDDATLTLPVWAKPPESISARDNEGNLDFWALEDEDGEDVIL